MKTETPTPHCTPDIAAWIDATGALQRADLLVVDLDTTDAKCTTGAPAVGLYGQAIIAEQPITGRQRAFDFGG